MRIVVEFVVGVVLLGLVLNASANLMSRQQSVQLVRWGWIAIFLYASYLILSVTKVQDFVRDTLNKFQGHTMLTYAIVALIGAGLSSVYLFIINSTLARVAPIEPNVGAASGGEHSISAATKPTFTIPEPISKAAPRYPTAAEIAKEIATSYPRTGPVPPGNLAARSLDLAKGIMDRLYMRGYQMYGDDGRPIARPPYIPPMPTDPKALHVWYESQSNYFRFRFLPELVIIRDDFARINVRKGELDRLLELEQVLLQRQKEVSSRPEMHFQAPIISTLQMEEICQWLKEMAAYTGK